MQRGEVTRRAVRAAASILEGVFWIWLTFPYSVRMARFEWIHRKIFRGC